MFLTLPGRVYLLTLRVFTIYFYCVVCSELNMSRRSAKRSIVWEYFEKKDDGSVICSKCKKSLKFFGNTTNLKEHLKRLHPSLLLNPSEVQNCSNDNPEPDELEVVQNAPVMLASTSATAVQPVVACSSSLLQKPTFKRKRQLKLYGSTKGNTISESEQEEIDKTLVEMIVSDFQPLSIVENKGFIKYTKKLNPFYAPPSRRKITSSLIPRMYSEILANVKNDLAKPTHVAITTDIWTSCSTRSFLAVTAHYIIDHELKSSLLETRQLTDRHSAENIARELRGIFNEWKIFEKVVTIVTDNASNMKNAVNEQLQKHHHPCVAHTLNLVVIDSLKHKDVQQLLDKCKNIVAYFKRSTLAADELVKMQHQMNLPLYKVKQEVPTRWNSCLYMMERLQEIKIPLSAAMTSLSGAPSLLSPEDWAVLNDFILVLKPMEALTTELSGEKYITVSIIIPLIRGLQHAINKIQPRSFLGENLKKDIICIISKRFGSIETSKINAKSTFLDPRFKKLGFGQDANADQTQKWITQEAESLMAKQSSQPQCPKGQQDGQLSPGKVVLNSILLKFLNNIYWICRFRQETIGNKFIMGAL